MPFHHKHDKRRRLTLAAAAAFLAGVPLAGFAQQGGASSYPDRHVRLVVPFTAGGGTDTLARLMASSMSKSLGQPVVVDNVGGAGGAIGAVQVARAPADGYTLMIGTPGTIQTNPVMQPDLRYSDKDFVAISQFSDSPMVLVVNRDMPWKSVRELVDAARANPGGLNYGSAGIGSIAHFGTEMFQMLAKVKMTHIPYKGTAEAMTALRGGTLQLQVENLPPVLGLIKGQQLRALAIGSTQRSALLPDVPTMVEAGVPGYALSSWTGLFAPAATPPAVLARIERSAMDAARDPVVLAAMRDLGAEPVGSKASDFRAFLASRLPLVEQTVKASGMSAK